MESVVELLMKSDIESKQSGIAGNPDLTESSDAMKSLVVEGF
jgi:hypothetical protein